ncbi:hypothetical protein AX14_014055 [Amanita brunnescens Koide BX004]|nr:hypothetical protein AX14_014055 [Amanita brunnescens Koide BX004]
MPHRSDRSSPPYSTSSARSASMSSTTANFIGAVEDEWQMYSDNPADYSIGDPIGFGASSIVYAATYNPPRSPKGDPCALKVLDLDSLPPRSLQLLQRETRLMSLSKHPNVLRVRGSWIDGHKLYIALRLMNKGSAADVMRYGWPGGMEEEVCRCVLRQSLLGLNYLHINGFIHRDVKAANLLIDDDGTVLLGDLGVAADLSEDSSHPTSSHSYKSYTVTAKAALSQAHPMSRSPSSNRRSPYASHTVPKPRIGKRKSFVGTPCWMAPELIQGKQYDSSADIWSFGITAIELTKGRPPRSRDPAKTVLLRTVQEDPPTIDRENGTFKYSRQFKEIVDRCLAKDPSKRPTAEELLQMPFFKGARKKFYLVGAILKDLPPLTQRLERCLVNHTTVIHRTVDSWDFGTTIHSPGSSVRRRMIFDFPFEPEEDNNSVFSPYDSDDEFGEELDVARGDDVFDNDYTPAPFTGKRTDAIPIPTSRLGPDIVTGTPSSFPGDDSTPSSASDSPITTPKSQAISSSEALRLEGVAMESILPPSMFSEPPSESIPSLCPPILEPESKPNVNKPRMAPASPPLPRSSHRRPATASGSNGFNQSPISTSPSNQGIWQKIRTNVRRPSFRASNESPPQPPSLLPTRATIKSGSSSIKTDIPSRESRQHDLIEAAVPERKEQSGVGRFASKGKQLYRKSSRTFQAVAFKQSSRS